MYRVYINDETCKDIRLQFQEVYDYLIDKGIELNVSISYLIDNFHNTINNFMEKYPNLKDNIDVLGDYDYYISCDNEDIAIEVESYFENEFEDYLSMIEDIVFGLEELEECEE